MTELGSAKAHMVEGCATVPSVRCDEYRRLASAESHHRAIVPQAVAALEERQGAQIPGHPDARDQRQTLPACAADAVVASRGEM